MRLAALVYDFPHAKSQDTIIRMAAHGWRPSIVIGAPRVDLPKYVGTTRISVRRGAVPTDKICASLGIPYRVCPHEESWNILRGYDLGVIGGARILPKTVIDCFSIGIVNLHPAPLPMIRGLDAIFWTIHEGVEPKVTAHLIDKRVDAGQHLLYRQVKVRHDDSIYDFAQKILDAELDVIPDAIEVAIRGRAVPYRPEEIKGNHRGRMPDSKQAEVVAAWPKYRDIWAQTT
jgi:hypothetical protein